MSRSRKADVDDAPTCGIVPVVTKASYSVPQTPAPEPVSFCYQLTEHGWASLEVLVGGRKLVISEFTSLTDGLGDLVRAALQVATGASHVGVIFDKEPRRWGLALEPAGLSPDNRRIARLTIRDGGTSLRDDGWSNQPVWRWAAQSSLEGHVDTDEFARAIQLEASRARELYDDETYRDRWGYFGSLEGFPLRGLRALEAALNIPEYRE